MVVFYEVFFKGSELTRVEQSLKPGLSLTGILDSKAK